MKAGVPVYLAAPGQGTTKVVVMYAPGHHKPSVVLATASRSFKHSSVQAGKLKLTKAGKLWVKTHRRQRVLVVVTFISAGAHVVIAQSKATL